MATINYTNLKSSGAEGKVTWTSPSNIAFVKYWGKRQEEDEIQLPMNPSLSMTLSESVTRMDFEWNEVKDGKGPILDFFFEGSRFPQFAMRIEKYLCYLRDNGYELLSDYRFKINAKNTFPHSAGIASSASSMSALALCLETVFSLRDGREIGGDLFLRNSSNLARLASGSASRSVWPEFSFWGKAEPMDGANDKFALPFIGAHESFNNLQDAILVVSDCAKSVSSGAGHQLMEGHPYAEKRFERAQKNFLNMVEHMREGDWKAWGEMVESEALDLHAMMMTSTPPYLLMKPNTLDIIERIRSLREETGLRIYFTLDAGPNIHLLFPNSEKDMVQKLIKEEFQKSCVKVIWDQMGRGPEMLELK